MSNFKEIDFEQEIKNYGERLNEWEKEVARSCFAQLLEQGKDKGWIYFAIQKLGASSIIQYRLMLLNNEKFHNEVDAIYNSYQQTKKEYENNCKQIGNLIEEQMQSKEDNQQSVEISPPKNEHPNNHDITTATWWEAYEVWDKVITKKAWADWYGVDLPTLAKYRIKWNEDYDNYYKSTCRSIKINKKSHNEAKAGLKPYTEEEKEAIFREIENS